MSPSLIMNKSTSGDEGCMLTTLTTNCRMLGHSIGLVDNLLYTIMFYLGDENTRTGLANLQNYQSYQGTTHRGRCWKTHKALSQPTNQLNIFKNVCNFLSNVFNKM